MTDCESQAEPDSRLLEYFSNAKQVLQQGMPPLFIGELGTQTVAKAGTIKVYFHGDLGKWAGFTGEVLDFWESQPVVSSFKRCAHIPVTMGSKFQELNPNAMVERIQCGGEIGVSGRFYSNALDHVIHCVHTLAGVGGPVSSRITFGDAWIRDVRVGRQYPDVVGKIQIGDDLETRLVGEIKFPGTVDITEMVDEAADNKSTSKVRAILGQVVKYMYGHRLKYAFLTNYKVTTFLKLEGITTGNGAIKPKIAFSKIIRADQTVGDNSVSVRLALFYLVNKVNSTNDDDWLISSEMAAAIEEDEWLSDEPALEGRLTTPVGYMAEATRLRSDMDSPVGNSGIVASQMLANIFDRRADDCHGNNRPAGIGASSIDDRLHGAPGNADPDIPPKLTLYHRPPIDIGSMRYNDETPAPKGRGADHPRLQAGTQISKPKKISATQLQDIDKGVEDLSVSDSTSEEDTDSSS